METQAATHGDFAVVTVLAHEWGHVNQKALEMREDGATTGLELHADCQAGAFAAAEQAVGNLDSGDLTESFSSLCAAADPTDAGAHGTCEERSAAFSHGYRGAIAQLPNVCGSDPLAAMQTIFRRRRKPQAE